MEIDWLSQVPWPQGLEKETAQVAQEIRLKYDIFFGRVQEGDDQTLALGQPVQTVGLREEVLGSQAEETGEGERWLLSTGDFEYCYALVRPVGIGCACPFTWVGKAEKIVDQQYPLFGRERFPDLFDKAAHILWLVMKTELYDSFSSSVGVLAALVLFERNGIEVSPPEDDLRALVRQANFSLAGYAKKSNEDDDDHVFQLGRVLRSWVL